MKHRAEAEAGLQNPDPVPTIMTQRHQAASGALCPMLTYAKQSILVLHNSFMHVKVLHSL